MKVLRRLIPLLIPLLLLIGCTETAKEDYSPKKLALKVEEAIYDGNENLELNYTNPIEEKNILADIERILNTSYVCHYFVEKIDVVSDGSKVQLAIAFKEGMTAPVLVTEKEEMLFELINSWEKGVPEVNFILKGFELSDEELFSILDTGEVNSSQVPCESEKISFEKEEAKGEQQLVKMQVVYPLGKQELLLKKEELGKKVEAYTAMLKKENKTGRALYEAVYQTVMEAATYDDEMALLVETSRGGQDISIRKSAYGALVSGYTVCTGYARGFQVLCDSLEIPCWTVTGTKDGKAHAWNIVTIDEKDYYVDCTAGDLGEEGFLLELTTPEYMLDDGIIIPESS